MLENYKYYRTMLGSDVIWRVESPTFDNILRDL